MKVLQDMLKVTEDVAGRDSNTLEKLGGKFFRFRMLTTGVCRPRWRSWRILGSFLKSRATRTVSRVHGIRLHVGKEIALMYHNRLTEKKVLGDGGTLRM